MKNLSIFIKEIFGIKEKKQAKDLYDFFTEYPEAKREKIIRKAIKGANEDQRLLIEKYNKLQHKTQ